jgi:hypothetical protein
MQVHAVPVGGRKPESGLELAVLSSEQPNQGVPPDDRFASALVALGATLEDVYLSTHLSSR